MFWIWLFESFEVVYLNLIQFINHLIGACLGFVIPPDPICKSSIEWYVIMEKILQLQVINKLINNL